MSKRKLFKQNDSENCLNSKIFKSTESTIQGQEKSNEKFLLDAAKSGFYQSVVEVIEKGANVNYQNDLGKRAADLAWENNHYKIVFELLKKDSEFPVAFDPQICTDTELKNFVNERTNFHESIKNGDLEAIKKYVGCIESKFYLNKDGKSACLMAIENEKFEIFVFLQSQSVDFKNETESDCINKLDENIKIRIRDLKRRYFYQIKDSHLLYLLSKSKIEGKINNAEKFVLIEEYFRELDQINEISTILKVCQYADNLSIVFDFNKEDIKCIDTTASANTRGRTYHSDNYIYIGAKTEKKSLLGTLAHELAHLAMQIVFKNNANPYFFNNNQKESQFNEIIELLRNRSVVDNIIKWVFYYDESRWAAELIVRVPHILAYYERDVGPLILNKQAKSLKDYFDSSVLSEFNKFIEKSFDLKPKENIRLLNIFVQEIKDKKIELKKNNKTDFLNNQNLIILKTNNVSLASADVLSKLEKSNFFNEYFLFIRFDFYLNHSQSILNVLNSHCKLLVIAFFEEPDSNLNRQLENLKQLNQVLKTKKIIFIFKENFKTKNLKNYFEVNYENSFDYEISDLTLEYQDILFEKIVLFQGNEISLNELITTKDNLNEIIGTETLNKIINDETIIIGKEIEISDEIKHSYINRSVNIPAIDLAIFKDQEINCKFAISNLQSAEFISLISENTYNEDPSRYFILDSQEELKFRILRESYSNIHWFKWLNNELIWIKSSGEISYLKKYLKKKSISKNEDILIQESERDVLLISNRAGMGKSTFLTKLSYDLKSNNTSSWVIKLNLINFSHQFSEIQSNQDLIEKLKEKIDFVDYFIEKYLNLKSELEKNLLKYYFENRIKTVIILLDGFDEISPYYEDTVIDFIKQINSIASKTWITTRCLTQKRLEVELNVLSLTLEPLNNEDQITFLVKKWNHNNSEQLDEALKSRAQTLIERMSTNDFSESDQIFTSNPLHLNMLAEVYKDNKNENSYSLLELYDEFIKMKFEIYCTEKKNQDKETLKITSVIDDNKIIYDSLLERHKKFAVHFLFTELENRIEMEDNENIFFDLIMPLEIRLNDRSLRPKILENIFSQEEIKNILTIQIKEKTGIIDLIDNKFRFIHRTFAEYFIAIYFIENLEKNNIQRILIEYVLIEDEFNVVREFINSKVKNKTNNLNFCNFERDQYYKCVHKASYEGNEQIVRFLVDSLNESLKEELFTSKYSLDSENESYNYNILLNAACNGYFTIIEYLIKKGYDVKKDFTYIMKEVNENIEFTENKFLNFLVDHLPVNIQDENGETLAHYFSKREDIEMLELLKTKNIDFSIKNNDGYTAIESIVKTCFNFNERPTLSDMKLSYDFLLPDSNYLSLEVKIMLSIHFDDLENLKEYLNDKTIDLNNTVKNYGPFSFKASRHGNIEIVKFLKNKGCDFKKKWKILDDYKYAYAYLLSDSEYEYNTLEVADMNNIDFLKFLIDEIKCEITPHILKQAILDTEISSLKLLLEKNADPNCLIEENMTPILYIVHNSLFTNIDCEKIEMLVNKGADILRNDGEFGNALHIAAFNDRCEFIKTLLKIAIETDKLKELLEPFNKKNAFQIATMNLNNKAATILKDFYADTNQSFTYEHNSKEIIRIETKALENIIINSVNSYRDINREIIRNFQLENY